MDGIRSLRYKFVKALCCPMPGLPSSTPLIGGKAALELFFVAIGTAVVVAMVIASGGGRTVGSYAEYTGVVMILLALRRMSFLSLLGISFERSIFWHKVVGTFYLFCLLIHGLTVGEINMTGLILGVFSGATALSYLFAYFQISFNLFYYFHIMMYIAIAPIAAIHGAKFLGLVAIIWGLDIVIRNLIQGKHCEAELSLCGEGIVKVNIAKNPYSVAGAAGCSITASLKPGMYCFVMIPKINYYEYHPFSIASGPNEDHLTFYIKAEGDWTEKLQAITKQQAAEKGQETAGHSEISLYLEGPYGNLSIDVFDAQTYPVAIMISGGVGITPMLGMLKHCLHLSLNGNTKFAESMSRVIFVWVCRDKAFADKLFQDCFSPLIEEHLVLQGSEGSNVYTLKAAGGKGVSFEFHFHVTERLVGANPNSSKQLQTVSVCVGASNSAPVSDANSAPQQTTGVELVAVKGRSEKDEEMVLGASTAVTSHAHSTSSVNHHWKKGRPNFEAIFANAAKAVEEKRAQDGATKSCCCPSRVSVSACGPSPLIHNIRTQVRSSSCSTGVTFDLHEELFFF